MVYIDDWMLWHMSYVVDGIYHANNRLKCESIRKILVDGIEQKMVIACNVSAGYIIRTKLNSKGMPYAIGGEFAKERVFGKVQVVLNDRD